MFGFGMTELVLILILVLFFTGAKRFPMIGEGLGKGITEFKKALRGKTSSAKEDEDSLHKRGTNGESR